MYKLSPSDFAYLYEDCKHCYYLKVRFGIIQPSMPMPGVFSAINTRLQGNLVGKNLKTLSSDLPDYKVIVQEGWVESKIIPQTAVFIKGKYDLLAKDKNGNHVLIDLKISQPHEDKIEKYKTQLGAYKFALENPKNATPIHIEKLALLIFYPDKVHFHEDGVMLSFPHTWLEVPVDNSEFLEFIKSVDKLLKGSLPEESKNCKWCDYKSNAKYLQEEPGEDLPF